MTSRVNGQTSPHTPAAAAVLQAPKKQDEKANSKTALVRDTLSQHSASTLSLSHDQAAGILNLSPVLKESAQLSPVALGLKQQEMEIVSGMFRRWALHESICLCEVFGLDIYTDLQELQKMIRGDERHEKVVNDYFCMAFRLFYCAARITKRERLRSNEPGAGRKFDVVSRINLASWVQNLEKVIQQLTSLEQVTTTKEELQPRKGTRARFLKAHLQQMSNRFSSVIKKLELLKALSTLDPSHDILLKSLSSLENQFPQSALLNKPDHNQTIRDLTALTQFVQKGVAIASQGVLDQACAKILKEFSEKIALLQTRQDKLKAIKQIKQEVVSSIRSLNSTSANEGATLSILMELFQDWLEILDEQVIVHLYPDRYVPASVCLERFNLNLAFFFQKTLHESDQTSARLPEAPCRLSSEQARAFQAIMEWQHKTMRAFISRLPDHREAFTKLEMMWIEKRKMNEARIYMNSWLQFTCLIEPILKRVVTVVPKLDDLRRTHLQTIEAFLQTFDKDDLRQNRARWIDFFKETAFYNSLDLCRLLMLSQDCSAIARLNVDLSVVNSEDHLLPEPLVDFMELEGIEPIFNRLLFPPQSPMREDLQDKPVKLRTPAPPSAPAPSAPTQAALAQAAPAQTVQAVEKLENKSNAASQASSPPLEDDLEPFAIRRGEKTRKMLMRLKALGFLPVSKRGSHQKLEGKEGQTVIVPTGGKRKHQKRGTAQGIASQANGSGS